MPQLGVKTLLVPKPGVNWWRCIIDPLVLNSYEWKITKIESEYSF